jgi:hypothetical protein
MRRSRALLAVIMVIVVGVLAAGIAVATSGPTSPKPSSLTRRPASAPAAAVAPTSRSNPPTPAPSAQQGSPGGMLPVRPPVTTAPPVSPAPITSPPTTAPPAMSPHGIPQQNAGDHDPDNNGATSDGDGDV